MNAHCSLRFILAVTVFRREQEEVARDFLSGVNGHGRHAGEKSLIDAKKYTRYLMLYFLQSYHDARLKDDNVFI